MKFCGTSGTIYKWELKYVQVQVKYLGIGVELVDKFIMVTCVVEGMPLGWGGFLVDLKVGSIRVDDDQTELVDGYCSTKGSIIPPCTMPCHVEKVGSEGQRLPFAEAREMRMSGNFLGSQDSFHQVLMIFKVLDHLHMYPPVATLNPKDDLGKYPELAVAISLDVSRGDPVVGVGRVNVPTTPFYCVTG